MIFDIESGETGHKAMGVATVQLTTADRQQVGLGMFPLHHLPPYHHLPLLSRSLTGGDDVDDDNGDGE